MFMVTSLNSPSNSPSSQTSEQLYQRAKALFPGGVHSPVRAFWGFKRGPLFFKKGEGALLESVEGEKFIDYCQSFGPNLLGHRDPEVQQEIELALEELWTSGAADPYSLSFSEWLCKRLPWLEMLRFVSSGTEAVMSALRLARGVTGREKVIKFEGCYHGHVDSMLVQAGSGLAGNSVSSSAGVSADSQQVLVAPLDDEEGFYRIMEEHGKEIAAVIIEPLPANFGLLPQRETFLKEIQKHTRANGSLFILDEVLSGFRAGGLGGMTAKWNLQPDLITYGKILGGGFPLSCYGGLKQYMEQMAPSGPVYQAGTLSAHPIALRAGFATLKKAEQEKVHESLKQSTQHFTRRLNELFILHKAPFSVVSQDSLFWIHVKANTHSNADADADTHSNADTSTGQPLRSPKAIPKAQKKLFEPLFLNLLKEGVYLSPHPYEVDFMSYAHKEEIIQKTLEAFDRALKTFNKELK